MISLSCFGIRVMEASEREFECFPPSLNFKNSLSRIVLTLLELLIISREDIWSWAFVCWKIFDHIFNFRICDSVQFSSVAQSCLTLCNPMDCSTPGLPVHHQLPDLAQTDVHLVGDAIKSFHPLSSPSPPTFNLSQHQGLFQWVNSSHEVVKVLEYQL